MIVEHMLGVHARSVNIHVYKERERVDEKKNPKEEEDRKTQGRRRELKKRGKRRCCMLASAKMWRECGGHAFQRKDLRSSLEVSVYKSSGSGRDWSLGDSIRLLSLRALGSFRWQHANIMPPQLPSNRPAVIQHIRKNSQLRPSAHNVSSPFHSGLFCWRVSAENMETLVSFARLSTLRVIVPRDCSCTSGLVGKVRLIMRAYCIVKLLYCDYTTILRLHHHVFAVTLSRAICCHIANRN